MSLTVVQQGILDFDIIKVNCYVLSNQLHVLDFQGAIQSIAEATGYKQPIYYIKDKCSFPVILGSEFIKSCKAYLKSQPKDTREFNVAEMFANLTQHVSIDAFIWQACIPDKDRIKKADFDDAISSLLHPPKIKK